MPRGGTGINRGHHADGAAPADDLLIKDIDANTIVGRLLGFTCPSGG
jgi:hypothetical protein